MNSFVNALKEDQASTDHYLTRHLPMERFQEFSRMLGGVLTSEEEQKRLIDV